ncbi:hypothetical protein NUSPORA_00682 [Nucleospora cyclopteri]
MEIRIFIQIFIPFPENMGKKEQNTKPISTSEAFHLLKTVEDRYKNPRSEAHAVYKKTLEYTETFCKLNDQSSCDLLKAYFTELGFKEEEVAGFCSLAPDTINEAKILIPSIIRLPDSIIDSAIKKFNDI